MGFYEALAQRALPVDISPSSTSYFSTPEALLDPRLFRSDRLISSVRDAILAILIGHLSVNYQSSDAWSTVWLAGSGVSYQWSASRDPGDLDCLIGVDFKQFRASNSPYVGLGDREIAALLNEGFRTDLQPETERFLDSFELTFYVNVNTDIRDIMPYAAYNLTADVWTVEPSPYRVEPEASKEWERKASRDTEMAQTILERYQQGLAALQAAVNPASRLNAHAMIKLATSQAASLHEDIHHSRGSAFSQSGLGYLDYANYRWQYGKETGAVQALKKLRDMHESAQKTAEAELYGIELPKVSTLIRRAALRYRT